MSRGRQGQRLDPVLEARRQGLAAVAHHPLFAPLLEHAGVVAGDDRPWGPEGMVVVDSAGTLRYNPRLRADPQQWQWAFAHGLLHLGFEHFRDDRRGAGGWSPAWRAAACAGADQFLTHLKVGRRPSWALLDSELGDEEKLFLHYADLLAAGRMPRGRRGTADGFADFVDAAGGDRPPQRWGVPLQRSWGDLLADGLAAAVDAAVAVAGREISDLSGTRGTKTRWARALEWFVSSYPLLGALASGFELVEDAAVCTAQSISVAAVSPAAAQIYVNPRAGLGVEECRFVIAHELLHAGLRHDTRRGGRHPELWNYACDYAVNGWLVEMGVGAMPEGCLYDPALKGMSSEEVYDRMARDTRRIRKLATLRGTGLGDVLGERVGHAAEAEAGVDLDEFYRRAIAQGLEHHRGAGRGLLPAGLEQEIRALGQPPVPWDVELARWFDEHFPAVEARRSYARASRRQAATPDIPRPSWVVPRELVARRTFAVVLDTSGSMPAQLLGKALGAIASYAVSHDVPAVRVVFCDAVAYDAGFLEVTEIARRVRVRGRGGTVLQPGVDLVESARDFPEDGPVLVITDGECDVVRIRREHAFLVPVGARLPFSPRGPVFRFA
ncbi:putative metal-dependent peptidase [Kineococcus xinjiangensis]|uniref:Putative metal-dependent peptidase n=1 Tax=Kineococcus xinjiangensis TaxID=512762 RepID=A0A2S6IT01_9ACTN|nr:hypothetical protein [Kineococcus xinjiangensis]PPK97384.1 putative metal-dependent peptidase [Kineococcus xinjiangensis]